MGGIGLAVMLGACGDDGSTSTGSGSTSDDPATSGGSTAGPASTSDGPASSGEPEDTTGNTSEVSTTGGSSGGTTDDDDDYFCNGWDENATEPFLDVYADSQQKTLLESGGTWPISCGGQGSWMFALFPSLGGFTPVGGGVEFAIDIEVEGFSGPGGQFHLSPGYPYDVVCSSGGGTFVDGGFEHDCIAILPPDEYLADLSVLDGAVATIDISLLGPDGTPVANVALTDVTLSARERRVTEDCFF